MDSVRANFGTSVRRRIYSEVLPLAELGRDETLQALATRQIELVVAVWPSTLAETLQVVGRAVDRGVATTLWPMLDDDDGRWVSVENVEPYAAFVRVVVDQMGQSCRSLLVDLEPPIGQVRAWLAGPWRAMGARPRGSFGAGRRALKALLDELGDRGIERTAAVIPLCVYDQPRGRSWQRLLGTPVDGMPFDHVSVMAYTTLFEGYSRGLLGRKDALMLLDDLCTAARTKYGARASISIGCSGTGAIGDEQAYRSLGELDDDLHHAVAAQIDDVALFDLHGVLQRPDAARWLDRFAARDLPRATAEAAVRSRAPSRRARILGWLFSQSFGQLDDETEELGDELIGS